MNDKTKKKTDEKKYVIVQYVGNFIGVLFVTPVLAGLVFVAFGQEGAGELLHVRAFVFLFIFFFMVIQPWGALTNTRKDYLRGKWIMAVDPPAGAEDRLIINPWRQVLPLTLLAGLITGAITTLALPWLGREPFHYLNVSFIAGIQLFAVSSILIGIILPRDQAAYAAGLARSKMPAVPFRGYVLIEHILPWVMIQGAINFAIGLKQFTNEALKIRGDIPIFTSAQDAGIVAAIIVFLMWMSSQVQVRPDVHLGRTAQDNGKALALPLMLLLILCFLAVGAVVFALLKLAGLSTISPLAAAILKAVVVMAMVVPGCVLGVWWGRQRETALIREKNSSPDQPNPMPGEEG